MEHTTCSCLAMTSCGLWAACPRHLTLCRLGGPAMLDWLVEAQHLPQAGIVEGLQLSPLCLSEGPYPLSHIPLVISP